MKWISNIKNRTQKTRSQHARSTILFLITLIFSLTFIQTAESAERRSFYEGSRGRAMGGAQIAVVNDETALLVNPAALGKLRDVYGTIFDPEIDYSNNFNRMNSTSPISDYFTVSGVKDSLNASREMYYHMRAQVFPSVVARNFGLGVYASYLLDAEMNAAGTAMNVFSRNDLAVVLGYNLALFDGRVKIGIAGKLLNRIEIKNANVNPNAALDDTTLGAAEGTALATDVGLILTAPWAMLPTITAVARDVGGTTFDYSHGYRATTTNRPEKVEQDVDVAFAFFPIHSNRVRSSFSVEYRGLLTASNEDDKAKLLHVGSEVNFRDILFLRAGYNQRYFTGGIEVASERTQLQLTTYGEEIGDQNAPREDRRTMLKFAFRF